MSLMMRGPGVTSQGQGPKGLGPYPVQCFRARVQGLMTPGHPHTIGNMSLQAHQMKIFILLQTLTTQPKLISIYGCFAIGWMISHERNSLVGFESSYMHF